MGSDFVLCQPGFPTLNSAFGQELENQGWKLKRHFRGGFLDLHLGIEHLHRAVDRIVDGGPLGSADEEIEAGVAKLESCSGHVEDLVQALLEWESALAKRASTDPDEPLVRREAQLRDLPYEQIFDELTLAGAALPRRALWQEVVDALRTGGTPAGLRVPVKTLRRLQGQLQTYRATVADHRRLPPMEQAEALHSMSVEGAAIHTSWTVFMAQAMYVSILSERATHRHASRLADIA